MWCVAMCYIPPPVDALVLSDRHSSKVFAISVNRDTVIWELQREMRGLYHLNKEYVLDRTSLLFHPEHNVLFVDDGIRERVLIADTGTTGFIQTIDQSKMGHICALGLYNDQLVMLHRNKGWKISYFNLL